MGGGNGIVSNTSKFNSSQGGHSKALSINFTSSTNTQQSPSSNNKYVIINHASSKKKSEIVQQISDLQLNNIYNKSREANNGSNQLGPFRTLDNRRAKNLSLNKAPLVDVQLIGYYDKGGVAPRGIGALNGMGITGGGGGTLNNNNNSSASQAKHYY